MMVLPASVNASNRVPWSRTLLLDPEQSMRADCQPKGNREAKSDIQMPVVIIQAVQQNLSSYSPADADRILST